MKRDKLVEPVHARAPSPWDKFSASSSPRSEGLEIEMRRSDGIPKLAPEVEQGNVEYKLILMNPTPERLHRLVTQLNWRLMEGNGQAYYQLGVADSGELVGLTKREMEATLETLENMAGELGASVVISREIEVRGSLSASLSLDSINGMGGKDMNGAVSSSSASPLLSASIASGNTTTDTETSETEGESENDGRPIGSATLNRDTAPTLEEGDPNEVIVRSAPVPITPSFLRRQKERGALRIRAGTRERTLMPKDFSSSPMSTECTTLPQMHDDEEKEEDDNGLGVFSFPDLQQSLDSISPASVALDSSLPAQNKPSKPPKPARPDKRPKGSKAAATSVPTKTPEQIAWRMAEKRAKRDKRREERKLALMDPVYDHIDLVTQDGGSGGINYESIVHDSDDVEDPAAGFDDEGSGAIVGPGDALMNAVATPTPKDAIASSDAEYNNAEAATHGPDVAPFTDVSPSSVARASELQTEPRLIVEALVVRKAGFGRGFVDLSQFDEELSYLPSFSLS